MAFDGVRMAEPQDEDGIFAMLLRLHEENGVFSVAEAKVRNTIRQATMRHGGVIGVIQGDKEIEASVGLEMSQWWYTEDWCLSEKWNFVLPEYRQSDHAIKLIEWSKWCASQQLHIPLQMGIISTKQTAAKVRLYERRMQNVGAMFMDGLPEGSVKSEEPDDDYVITPSMIKRMGDGDITIGKELLSKTVAVLAGGGGGKRKAIIDKLRSKRQQEVNGHVRR